MGPGDITGIIGLGIQAAGILMVASLSFFMTRSIKRASLGYWTAGWICLYVSLVSLIIAFQFVRFQSLFHTFYFLGEYAFGYMFVMGSRNYASGAVINKRHAWLLIPAILVATVLAVRVDEFKLASIPHSAIVAALFACALGVLWPFRKSDRSGPGFRVMLVALVMLALDFAHYVAVFSFLRFSRVALPLGYLKYTSVYDLILETLLGFGTLMLVMDNARQEVEVVNRELIAARDRLEVLAGIDPLTEALNRHAFYSLLKKKQSGGADTTHGCVVVLDIDSLKPINDSLGHAAGDAAIREVASCVRSIIRSDDLLFRWGGDEFLILFFGAADTPVYQRLTRLDQALCARELPGFRQPVSLIVSYGVASFATINAIEEAIDEADAKMYEHKQSRKQRDKRVG
jgi:diguanylate cyclase (GGDEF)-like protein